VSGSLNERRVGLALALIAILFYPLLLWRGWGCWNDAIVDYGRELYVPWRINEGDVLYRDIAYFNGPLSPYINALWFFVGGVGLRTLTIANAIIALVFGVVLYRRTKSSGGPIAAGITLLAFEFIFACGHYPGTGNYNFLSPYSHELTHGLLLALLAFSCALRARAEGTTRWAWAAGLLLGLCFLTKAEVFVAAAGSISWILALAWRSREAGILRRAAIIAGSAALCPLIAFALLALAMPLGDALYATMGSWTGIFGSTASDLLFYKIYTGFDRAGENLAAIFSSCAVLIAILTPAALFDRFQGNRPLALRLTAGLVYSGAIIVLFKQADLLPFDWLLIARFLPLFVLLALGAASLCALRGEKEQRALWGERAGFALFALLMMLKMILLAILAHYGFALAVCAVAIFAIVILEWLPALCRGENSRGLTLRLAGITLILVTISAYWMMSESVFASKNVVVSEGADQFNAITPHGQFLNELLVQVDDRIGKDQSLLVFPEGVMVNYLTRRKTPARQINFMPPEIALFGEENLVKELRQAESPAAVILIHKDTTEYGFPLFGTHYGMKLMGWAQRNYKPDWLIGDPPLQPTTRFGIGLLGPR
jgi:hypothetical protein